jgi:hypothetical protein
LNALLVEFTFSRFHRIPFTCGFPPFRQSFPLTCLFYLLGYSTFIWAGGALQAWLEPAPVRILVVAVLPVALWLWNEFQFREDRKAGDPQVQLAYAHIDEGSLALLAITDTVRAQVGRDGNG